jgi:2,3-bisphosphoglycerate-dependent phosphoglycerate mutase
MALLVLVRHGKSEWNTLGKWTGFTDVDLNAEGVDEARRAGEAVRDIHFDIAFVSDLKRAQETLSEMQKVFSGPGLKTVVDPAIKERDYGVYTGKNKWDVKKEVGEEKFQRIRRSWDEPIPGGEMMKDVYARVVPYYESHIVPELKAGKNVLVVAHGNSLRALVKYLEQLSNDELAALEFGTGEVYVYTIDASGAVTHKEIRAVNADKQNV